MQQRYRSSRDIFSLEATCTEIVDDFKEMSCGTYKSELSSPEMLSKKRSAKKTDQIALNGVLGLASLISDRDLRVQKVPDDWFQQYPLMKQNSWDTLPTGIQLQSKQLLSDSFSIYYQDREQSMIQN